MGEILDHYGRDTPHAQAGRAVGGGCCEPKDLPYSPPVGPTPHMRRGPGLGGENYGTNGTQGKY